jgi:hypothetical protein
VLAYLSRYTHGVAISNSRLIALDGHAVAFKWKDYRIDGRDRYKTMTLDAHEFIRRRAAFIAFAITACSPAASAPTTSLARANCSRPHPLRKNQARANDDDKAEPTSPSRLCPCCGGRMNVIETFERGRAPRGFSLNDLRIGTS